MFASSSSSVKESFPVLTLVVVAQFTKSSAVIRPFSRFFFSLSVSQSSFTGTGCFFAFMHALPSTEGIMGTIASSARMRS